jgi:hypothetical protein
VADQVQSPPLAQHAVLQLRNLRVRSRRGQHDTYGSALAAHPGWSQGRPITNASSQVMM